MSTKISDVSRKAIEAFLAHKSNYDAKAANGPFGYHEDFAKLRQSTLKYRENPTYKAEEGAKPFNYRKNRYKDILPYDYTRVVLSEKNDTMGTDYINANFITMSDGNTAYIAAQGPLPNTVHDFWRLLWEQKASVVIMACNEYEGDPPKHKCERYWVESVDEDDTVFDRISVSLERDVPSQSADYKIRYLRAQYGNEVTRLYQMHFMGWPDHGVPESVGSVIDLLSKAYRLQGSDSSPLVIHCSAGCGRTGTLVVVDMVLKMLRDDSLPKDFDLFSVIDDIRKQRPSMVQSLDQYRFVFDVVEEIFKRTLEKVDAEDAEDLYSNVTCSNDAEYVQTGDLPRPPAKPPVRTKPTRPGKPPTTPTTLPDLITFADEDTASAKCLPKKIEKDYFDANSMDKSDDAQYAYANPNQRDKWEFQHVALGESFSNSSSEGPPTRKKPSDSEYQDIDSVSKSDMSSNSDETMYVDPEDEFAPPVPSKKIAKPSPLYSAASTLPTSGTATINRKKGNMILDNIKDAFVRSKRIAHDGEMRPILYKGIQVGFPHRVGTPIGPRKTMTKS